jgi:hypothetical protein
MSDNLGSIFGLLDRPRQNVLSADASQGAVEA